MPPPDLSHLPHRPGVYLMRDNAGKILYIGKAVDLRKRVAHYFRPKDPKIRALMAEVRHIDYVPAEGEREALVVEQRLIRRHRPLFNTMWRDDKSYPFLKLTVNEDFPRLFLTRRRTRDGALYFGPYPNTSSVRGLLAWTRRRGMFPLRPCDYDFSEARPLDPRKSHACLYLHTGQCPAPCVGKISKPAYQDLAREAALFFAGKNEDLAAAWESEMRAAAGATDFERAARLRDNVAALRHVAERVTFRALREEDVQGRIQASRVLRELQELLGLPRPPLVIEGFDISHVQGSETVASLVSFHRGAPRKAAYRTFKIKTVAGVDDFASMAEVVGRRYKRLKEEGAALPDLVLIDGGPGQLGAALEAVKEAGVRLSLASLAKREEEVYLPDRKEPLRLPKDSPALQLLQRVRDESHRFAVSFHRRRRGKGMLGG